MTTEPPAQEPREMTEEEYQAAMEAQIKQLRVDDILREATVSLISLGGRKAGMAPGTEDERDLEQLRTAIDAVRGLIPVLERLGGPEVDAIKDAVSQLQMAYAQATGTPPDAPAPGATPPASGGAAPPAAADRPSGLWVPGQ